MLIRFFNTLREEEDSYLVQSGTDLTFENGEVHFMWLGSRLAIDVKDIISIERV